MQPSSSGIFENLFRETEKQYPRECDAREAELFSEFDFDPEEMRQAMADYSYRQFVEVRDADFADECAKFTDRDVYTKAIFDIFREGPNCYAFAFQWTKNPRTGEIFSCRPIPGEIAHGVGSDEARYDTIMESGSPRQIKEYLEGRIRDDLEYAGLEMVEVPSQDYKLKDGEWMIAMVSGKDVYRNGPDFHFYRMGDAGTWYHKPGMFEPTMLDESGNEIFDPKKCDRGDYDTFHGYYVVRPSQRA